MTINGNRAGSEAPRRPPRLDVKRHALFLDIDGTLLDIQERPDMVRADAALREMMRLLTMRLDGALAIVTGRTIADADRVLGDRPIHIAGLHGMQTRRGEKTGAYAHPSENLSVAVARVRRLIEGKAFDALLEDKDDSIALHYRAVPEQGQLIRRCLNEVAGRYGLRTIHGKMVSEIMPLGPTKGHVVRSFMETAPFRGRVPVAIGDDATDEDAFDAAPALGGFGIYVGDRHDTCAAFDLPNTAAVRAWLAEAAWT